jgi:hypothetical protein
MMRPQVNLEPQMNFDTHKSIKFLVAKGMKTAQAESIVEVVSQSRDHDYSKLATRDQLKLLEAETRGEFKAVRGKIAALREELKGEIKASEERVVGQIISANHNTLKWMVALLVGVMLAVFFKH